MFRPSFFKLSANFLLTRWFVEGLVSEGFLQVFKGGLYYTLILLRARVCTHIHITLLPNPSPYSPSDEMDGFFIYIRTFATISATLQRKHIIRWINGLWWQIICNGQHSSATAPWQMWQMGFNASATGTYWFSSVWVPVADVYVILYDNSLFCHPEELCDKGSRVHTLYYSLLYVHEILRFALDDTIKDE